MEVWERCSAAHLVSLLQGGGGGLIPGAAHHLCHAVFWGRAMPTESESPEWKPEPLILISSSPALQQLLSPLPDDTEPVTLDTESLPRSSPWGEESHGEWNEQDSEDRDSLRRHGVTHILSVHNRAKPVLEDMTYLCISASDSSSQNLIQHFKESIKFIHECRLRGGGCLVHCTEPGSVMITAGTPSRTRRSCNACWPSRSKVGAGGTPAPLPQHPPTHCPVAGANGWTDKQQLLPERHCPCALQNVTATLPSTCGVQLQWGKGWGRTTQLRSCRGCSAAASHPPAPLYGKNQLLLRIRGAEPHCTLKPFSGSPREDAILYSSISKNSLSGNFWVLEPASGTKPVLSCQGMGGG
ncbi:uncharacterized protein DUSP22AL isoform X4 [Gallus gallus]|uniref:uncharacterized protein DUSP22AL isoform X4 n=1 Tax=Gallus gallus TaxID=9031 RepID=UPI000D63FD97|nr:uncharacterized protein DUSP22AL isoform X4 [Gallus gallus]|eukprot:XP_025010093.1 uncharacterized protein DUSP22AL isoform X1 [Gallus gallus]